MDGMTPIDYQAIRDYVAKFKSGPLHDVWPTQSIADFADQARTDLPLLLDRVEELEKELGRLRDALGHYAACWDGCTCGDGWSHDAAREALALNPIGKEL